MGQQIFLKNVFKLKCSDKIEKIIQLEKYNQNILSNEQQICG
jgi:hypothetical protein